MGEGQKEEERDFYWVDNSEPHSQRRRAILAKHGDAVRALYGYDHSTAVQVVGVCLFSVFMAYWVRDMAWWKVILLAYSVGGTASQNLFTAQHELSHFLAFRKPVYSRILSIVSNCPLVVPMATAFRKYHQEHHSHLGVDGWDVDLPTVFEKNMIASFFAKVVWVFCYIGVYGIRPLIVKPKPIGGADLVCLAAVLGFDAALWAVLGTKALAYLLLGSLLGGGLHPMAGHLIAEHYMFLKGQETYSYYGPLNALTYNVGYHNEHHDFPQIPHTRLHKLKEIAPEFYEPLACHQSWCWVIWKFLTDPEVGPWSRLRRETREGAAVKAPTGGSAAAAGVQSPPAPLEPHFLAVEAPLTPSMKTMTPSKKAVSSTPSKRAANDFSALLDVSNLDSPGVRTRAMARRALPMAAC